MLLGESRMLVGFSLVALVSQHNHSLNEGVLAVQHISRVLRTPKSIRPPFASRRSNSASKRRHTTYTYTQHTRWLDFNLAKQVAITLRIWVPRYKAHTPKLNAKSPENYTASRLYAFNLPSLFVFKSAPQSTPKIVGRKKQNYNRYMRFILSRSRCGHCAPLGLHICAT